MQIVTATLHEDKLHTNHIDLSDPNKFSGTDNQTETARPSI
jgi:hypothetical protein